MEIDVAQFAAQIMQRPDPAALLIGFDGGAALLNHHRPAIFRDDLLSGVPVREPDYEMQRMAEQWRKLRLASDRERFMREHTRPIESDPDERAIECIANLVADNRIKAIIATDTSMQLFRSLNDLDVFMEPFSCPEAASAVLKEKISPRLLIDGGDLLIHGQLYPSMYGRPMAEMLPMRDAIKAYLRSFSHVYCWGWCDLNLPLDWIYPDNDRPQLTAIGSYTARCIRLSSDFTIVRGGRDSEYGATNEILYELANALEAPARPQREPRSQRAPQRRVRSGATAPRYLPEPYQPELPLLLLHEAAKTELLENLSKATVSVIGIEGELVRRRCAAWLAAAMRKSGRPSVSFEGNEVAVLARRVAMRLAADDSAWVIGNLTSDAGEPEMWSSILVPSVQRWCADAHREGQPDRRVALFVSTEVSKWAAGAFERERAVRVESFFASSFLTEDVVADWLVQNVGPLLTEDLAKGSSASTLARRMVDSARERASDADWLHDALDLWYLDVERAERRHDAG